MPSRRCSGEFDQKQPAKRPEGLAAEALFALLVDHDDAFAGIGDFGRGDQPGQSAADHDHVRIASHRFLPIPVGANEARHVSTRSTAKAACLWRRSHELNR